MRRILLLSDHAPTRLFLRYQLAGEFQVVDADTPERAAEHLKSCRPEALLVAWKAREGQGVSFTRGIRRFSSLPILYLATQAEADACVAVLDAGADDFIHLPCGEGELRARIRSALRRNARCDHDSALKVGGLTLDPVRRTVSRDEQDVRLTALEYWLFETLAKSVPGLALSARELLQRVWGARDWDGDTRRLRTCLKKLRRKVEPDPARPRYLLCVPRLGYRLERDTGADG